MRLPNKTSSDRMIFFITDEQTAIVEVVDSRGIYPIKVFIHIIVMLIGGIGIIKGHSFPYVKFIRAYMPNNESRRKICRCSFVQRRTHHKQICVHHIGIHKDISCRSSMIRLFDAFSSLQSTRTDLLGFYRQQNIKVCYDCFYKYSHEAVCRCILKFTDNRRPIAVIDKLLCATSHDTRYFGCIFQSYISALHFAKSFAVFNNSFLSFSTDSLMTMSKSLFSVLPISVPSGIPISIKSLPFTAKSLREKH